MDGFDVNCRFSDFNQYPGNGLPAEYNGYTSIAEIQSLSLGVISSPLIGFVISKEDPREFAPKDGSDASPRSVLSFTLRDSPFDYINVALWGKVESVQNICASFSIGDIVQVTGCNVKEKQPGDERFKPWTPGSYHIVLNEAHSTITPYEGNREQYERLAHMPIQNPGPIYQLAEITAHIQDLQNATVSFTAALRWVGSPKCITGKLNGRKMQLLEFKLFDQRADLIWLTIWSRELMQFSNHWIPGETILSLVDVKVHYDQYKKAVVASANSRSIIILNPGIIGQLQNSMHVDTQQAASLYQYARTKSWPEDTLEEIPQMRNNVDLSTVTTRYSVLNFADQCGEIPPGGAIHAIVYCYLTSFDIDGTVDNVLAGKCCECGRKLPSLLTGQCTNYDCLKSDILDFTPGDLYYSLKVELSDYSGTLNNCKISAETVASMLQVKPEKFIQMTDETKTVLKWKFLFEKCQVILKAYRNGDFPVSLVILQYTPVSCDDYLQNMD